MKQSESIAPARPRAGRLALLLAAVAACAGCGAAGGAQYEYEEEIRLDLSGSATVLVNASVASLVALRGLDLDPSPRARLDRSKVRAAYESPVTRVTRVSRPWRRHGRRFVQIRLQTDDIRALSRAAPFAWSRYELRGSGPLVEYRQEMADPAGAPPAGAGWRGDELVAVRLHLPSRIRHHNAGAGNLRRGNILVWEQPLAERLAGRPLAMEVRMENQSILYRTLWLFALSFGAALSMLAGVVWWTMRRGQNAA